MKVTPREKAVIERFNNSIVELEPSKHGKRPTDAELQKMSDAEVLAGDWLVDIEDTTFWNRWDEANANLTIDNGIKYYTPARIAQQVKSGKACWLTDTVTTPNGHTLVRYCDEHDAPLINGRCPFDTLAEARK